MKTISERGWFFCVLGEGGGEKCGGAVSGNGYENDLLIYETYETLT